MNNIVRTTLIKIPFVVSLYLFSKKLIALPWFLSDYFKLKRLSKNGRFVIKLSELFPCLMDKTITTKFESHYIYHPAWAARIIKKISPEKHIDISSSLHFSTMLSAFIPVEYYDYRPAPMNLDNLISKKANLISLPFEDGSIKSLSCMHVVEHIGLGRYGDPLDVDGDIKAIRELTRVLSVGGSLLFVVPVGKPKIQFNAHRIYSYEQVVEYFADLKLKEFSLVPDDYVENGLIINADPVLVRKQNWGCGCFWFTKE